MPRIRTIKPEFWADEKLSLLDPLTRLVFLGLISMADDYGRLVDNVKALDGQLFPSTDDSCRDALETLAATGRILRYRATSGQAVIQVVNWERHQKVLHPGKAVLPPPDAAAIVHPACVALAEHARTSRDSQEERERTASDPLASTKLPSDRVTKRPSDHPSVADATRRGAGAAEPFILAPYLDAHLDVFPGSSPPGGRFGKVFKRLERKHGREETLRRWRICLARKHTFATPEELASHWSEYADGDAGLDPLARQALEDRDRADADEAWLLERKRSMGLLEPLEVAP